MSTAPSRAARTEARSFEPIAATLRSELTSLPDLRVTGPVGRDTIEINSGFVERRGQPLVDMILARVGRPSLASVRLLDAGCGFGALSAFFAFRGAHVVGIDPHGARLEVGRRVAARHGLDVDLARGRMETLDVPAGSFDVVAMNNSLCYLVDRGERLRALELARRALAPGGAIVLRNPNLLHPVDRFTGLPLIQFLPPTVAVRAAELAGRRRSYCRLRSPRGMRRELLDAGFELPVHHRTSGRWARPQLVAQYSHLSAKAPGPDFQTPAP